MLPTMATHKKVHPSTQGPYTELTISSNREICTQDTLGSELRRQGEEELAPLSSLIEALELPQGAGVTRAPLLAAFTVVPGTRATGVTVQMRFRETPVTVYGAPITFHSSIPPNGRCWTTTRFPRISA